MAKETKTDLIAGTLSDEDREKFLRAQGLTPETPPEEAEKIRKEWPDEDILMTIGSGLF
jgi:hypothetical protein